MQPGGQRRPPHARLRACGGLARPGARIRPGAGRHTRCHGGGARRHAQPGALAGEYLNIFPPRPPTTGSCGRRNWFTARAGGGVRRRRPASPCGWPGPSSPLTLRRSAATNALPLPAAAPFHCRPATPPSPAAAVGAAPPPAIRLPAADSRRGGHGSAFMSRAVLYHGPGDGWVRWSVAWRRARGCHTSRWSDTVLDAAASRPMRGRGPRIRQLSSDRRPRLSPAVTVPYRSTR